MQLWYSTTSPYARKVIVALHHHQLTADLQRITASFDPNSPHNQVNPLGRVPALQSDNGQWLFGSLLICEYLDSLGTQSPLFPEGERRWDALALHALADGVMENTMPMIAEKMRRPKAEWWTARHQQFNARNQCSFAQLEAQVETLGNELNIGTLTLVCLVDWWQFRQNLTGFNLNGIAPKLLAWAAAMNARYPVLQASQPQA